MYKSWYLIGWIAVALHLLANNTVVSGEQWLDCMPALIGEHATVNRSLPNLRSPVECAVLCRAHDGHKYRPATADPGRRIDCFCLRQNCTTNCEEADPSSAASGDTMCFERNIAADIRNRLYRPFAITPLIFIHFTDEKRLNSSGQFSLDWTEGNSADAKLEWVTAPGFSSRVAKAPISSKSQIIDAYIPVGQRAAIRTATQKGLLATFYLAVDTPVVTSGYVSLFNLIDGSGSGTWARVYFQCETYYRSHLKLGSTKIWQVVGLTDGSWMHIGVRWNYTASEVSLWVDGVMQSTIHDTGSDPMTGELVMDGVRFFTSPQRRPMRLACFALWSLDDVPSYVADEHVRRQMKQC